MKVLFICKGNMFRSQMAAAIYNKLTGTQDAFSVGTTPGALGEPEGQILRDLPKQRLLSEHFFDVMDEHGMDVRSNKTVRLLPEMLGQYNRIVCMAEDPHIPDFLKSSDKVVWWSVKNPSYVTREIAKNTFNQISRLVKDLIG